MLGHESKSPDLSTTGIQYSRPLSKAGDKQARRKWLVMGAAPQWQKCPSDLHDSERGIMTNCTLHSVGLVSPTLIQAFLYHRAFYTLRFPESKFQQEAGKSSQEEG